MQNFLTSKSTAELRMELAQLRAHSGAVAPAIYIVIQKIETDISWTEHQRVRS